MPTKTESGTKRPPSPGPAAFNGQHERGPRRAGIDLPVLGHVSYQSAGFFVGLGVAGVAGAIDWPVAAVVGAAYLLARR